MRSTEYSAWYLVGSNLAIVVSTIFIIVTTKKLGKRIGEKLSAMTYPLTAWVLMLLHSFHFSCTGGQRGLASQHSCLFLGQTVTQPSG